MSYKTILVHLSDKRRAERLLEPAIDLSTRFNAHLIGLHVYAALPAPPVSVPFAKEVAGTISAADHTNSAAIADIFSRMTKGGAFVPEWRLRKVPHVDLAAVVTRQAHAADLVITGQSDPDWDMSPLLDFPLPLAVESGRPVLVIPYAGRFPRVARNVVIAWKPGREAARAVFDALPLLKAAENVHILEIRSAEGKEADHDTSIAAALGRHGIKPNLRTSIAPDLSVGDELLSRIADLGADLLVMGAYGHSRMRELVFGGATRDIARHMTVPTLFSH
jgi:nucleotide-binding universal stress UspA family protein